MKAWRPSQQTSPISSAGTHDNSTAVGWWEEDASAEDKRLLQTYLGLSGGVSDIAYKLIEVGMRSVAKTTIFTIQVRAADLAPAFPDFADHNKQAHCLNSCCRSALWSAAWVG